MDITSFGIVILVCIFTLSFLILFAIFHYGKNAKDYVEKNNVVTDIRITGIISINIVIYAFLCIFLIGMYGGDYYKYDIQTEYVQLYSIKDTGNKIHYMVKNTDNTFSIKSVKMSNFVFEINKNVKGGVGYKVTTYFIHKQCKFSKLFFDKSFTSNYQTKFIISKYNL